MRGDEEKGIYLTSLGYECTHQERTGKTWEFSFSRVRIWSYCFELCTYSLFGGIFYACSTGGAGFWFGFDSFHHSLKQLFEFLEKREQKKRGRR